MLRRLEYKWIVATVYVLGLFMNLLDLTITNVALPTLARDFHATTTAVAWVATGYLLSVAVCIPVSGWLGDRFGHKNSLTIALLWWSAFTGVTGWLGAQSSIAIPTLLLTFSIVRFLVGVGEAVAYPASVHGTLLRLSRNLATQPRAGPRSCAVCRTR